jgi:hypothetical protein
MACVARGHPERSGSRRITVSREAIQEEETMRNQLKTAAEPVSYKNGHIFERPDGYYWKDRQSGQEYGPFASLRDAEDDMEFASDTEGDDLVDGSEDELGIADWIDPDTGEPGQESVPHIHDD